MMTHIPKFLQMEAIEIRFHGVESSYQLLATVSRNGAIDYSLNNNPAGSYEIGMTILGMDREEGCFLPRKAYVNWQEDLLAWISNAKRKDGTTIYTITEVL